MFRAGLPGGSPSARPLLVALPIACPRGRRPAASQQWPRAVRLDRFNDDSLRPATCCQQDPAGQWMVVPRSEGSDAVADERVVELRTAVPLPGYADGFAVVHVLPAA